MNNANNDQEMVYMMADFYKILSDVTRLKIINVLMQGEFCVQCISKQVDMSQTAVSYQLRILRGARLVKYRRSAQQVYYSIDDEHVSKILSVTIEHLVHGDHK